MPPHDMLAIVSGSIVGFVLGLITGEDYMDELSIMTVVAAIIGAIVVVFAWRAIAGRSRTAV